MSLRPATALGLAAVLALALPAAAAASAPSTGGTAYVEPAVTPQPRPKKASKPATKRPARRAQATLPGTPAPPTATATVGADGLAAAPAEAPPQVAALVAAGNVIAKLPYRYGGGHGSFVDTAYDCSGSVSYVLHAAGLLDATLDSTGLAAWGQAGPGQWITVYANKTHTFLIVAGVRFDTSGRTKAGSRWQTAPRSLVGFRVRHPVGL